jgi:hypothetical protein
MNTGEHSMIQQCISAARLNVEQHLGDGWGDEDSADTIYDEAWTLAFDAAFDAGADRWHAALIANSVAESFNVMA